MSTSSLALDVFLLIGIILHVSDESIKEKRRGSV
jgi:hypothetical protein